MERKESTEKLKRSEALLILEFSLIFIGIYLIFDGYISILAQQDQPFIYQFFRYVRILIGIIIIMIGINELKYKLKKIDHIE